MLNEENGKPKQKKKQGKKKSLKKIETRTETMNTSEWVQWEKKKSEICFAYRIKIKET